MNQLLRRGISAYRIVLKNKLAMSVMMLVSGVMMFIAAVNGKGNDTVMMPLGITVAGAAFTCWAVYRVGYIKSNLDRSTTEDEKKIEKAVLTLQVVETLIYFIVAALGIFLLINQSFTNMVLNLMAGGFTTLNGVFGVIFLVRNHDIRGFRFYFKVVLTIVELVFGIYFVVMCNSIEIGWFVAMGTLTMIAGAIEVKSALTPESIRSTMRDGKAIVKILKDD